MRLFVTWFVIFLLSISWVSADFWSDLLGWWSPEIRYCQGDECWLQQGVDLAWWINDIETWRTTSQYVQDVIAYLLTFISIAAVIYIIYAGFRILVWNGDEEQLKKSKQTILYVIIGIVLIWLAWSIVSWIFLVLQA